MVLSTFFDKYMPRRGSHDIITKIRNSLKRELSKISEVWEDDKEEEPNDRDDQTESNFRIDPSNLLVKDFAELKKLRNRKIEAMVKVIFCVIGITVLSWIVGATGASWAWIIIGFILAGSIMRSNLQSIVEDDIRFQKIRLHKKRALETDETCEWLNLFLNRWWVFSSTSIFTFGKKIVDPLLQESKPSFVEAVSLKEMTLGDRTPMLRNIRCWDAHGVGGQEQSAFKTGCSMHTPSGLALAPTHALAVLCEFTLDSDSFSAILGARVGHKGMGVDLDIGVEHLVLEGRVLFTLYFDMEAPFPHLARASFSFVEQPRVSFRIKMLKTVQMMEMPILKTWIYSLVTEALATAFVDPSQLEFSINSNETFISDHRHRQALAKGVLTISLRLHRNTSTAQFDEDKWIVVVVGGSTHITPCFKSTSWEDSCSFLLFQTIASSTVSIKVKSKRLITTTIAQFDLPLFQYNLDTSRMAEIILQKKGVRSTGSGVPALCVKMDYQSLAAVSLEEVSEAKEEACESGVLYIVIHGADNLTSRDDKPSPYCLLFNKRKKINATHFERGTLSPRWESEAEILVTNLSSVCLTLLVCSKNSKQQDGDLLGIQTLKLSSVTLPLIRKKFPLNRNSSSPCPEEAPSSNSTITLSVVFRSVPSLAPNVPSCTGSNYSKGVALPVPMSLSTSSISSDLSPVSNTFAPLSPNLRASAPDDEGQQKLRKRINPRWLSHAKELLSSHGDGDYARSQDLEGIFATGLGLIELTIIRARDLVSKDLNGFSDPYCVLKVNGEVKYRTQVKKKTLHPEWNENLMTHLPKPGQNLMLTLWDHDAFGMKDFLGSISLTEEQIRNLSASNSADWFRLEGAKSGCIEIKIKLIYENQEFYNQGEMMAPSENNDTLSDDASKTGSDNSSHEKDSKSAIQNKSHEENALRPTIRNTSPYIRRKQMLFEEDANLPKSSSISVIPNWEESCKNQTETTTPSVEHFSTPTRRKSGAEIISSVISDVKYSPISSDSSGRTGNDPSEEASKNDNSKFDKLKKEINKLNPISKSENKLTIVDQNPHDETALINTPDNDDENCDNNYKESKFKDRKKRHIYSQLKMKMATDKDKPKDSKISEVEKSSTFYVQY